MEKLFGAFLLINWGVIRSSSFAFHPTSCLSSRNRLLPLTVSDDESVSFGEEVFDFYEEDFQEFGGDDDDEPIFFEATTNASKPLTLDQLGENFASNMSYFYLKNELGLSEAAMWRITYDASSALGMQTQVVKEKVELLRRTMDLSDDDIRSILEKQPTVLHLSAKRNLSPTLLFLLRSLDLGREELRRLVVASPSILSYSISNLKAKVGFFTHVMEYSVQECRELFLREPGLLRASVINGLGPHLRFLANEMEMDLPQLQIVVKKNPRILLYSLEKNLVPKLIYYLLMKLHMSTDQVQRLLLAYPRFVDYNLDRVIWPITFYFVNDLGFNINMFRSVLLKFPRLVTHSMQKIKYAVGFFRYELGMSASEVQRVLVMAPTVMGLDVDRNVKAKVSYLQASLGLDQGQLRALIVAAPSVLILNTEDNVKPKIKFLKEQFVADIELRDAILRMPSLLAYSLDKRIRPRMAAILKTGLDPASITVAIAFKASYFEKWLQRRVKQSKLAMEPAQIPPAADWTGTSDNSNGSKRITHWTRKRRPRPYS